MLKNLQKNNAQIVIGEYVLLFFVVTAVIGAMTIYVRRALQGRLRDAQLAMYETATPEIWVGTGVPLVAGQTFFFLDYEPYYVNRTAMISRTQNETRRLSGSFNAASGIFRYEVDNRTQAQMDSVQLPPAFSSNSAI